jgi:type IV pilus assembly protein PilA
MFKAMKKKLKDQRGLTLIELLAVVVILGIIAAIAVPSIGGLIENTKKDAHIANAQQMVSSARLAVNAGDVTLTPNQAGTAETGSINLATLVSKGYMETITNPSDKANGYNTSTSLVNITKTGNAYTFTVTLVKTGSNVTAYFTDANISTLTKTGVTTN